MLCLHLHLEFTLWGSHWRSSQHTPLVAVNQNQQEAAEKSTLLGKHVCTLLGKHVCTLLGKYVCTQEHTRVDLCNCNHHREKPITSHFRMEPIMCTVTAFTYSGLSWRLLLGAGYGITCGLRSS